MVVMGIASSGAGAVKCVGEVLRRSGADLAHLGHFGFRPAPRIGTRSCSSRRSGIAPRPVPTWGRPARAPELRGRNAQPAPNAAVCGDDDPPGLPLIVSGRVAHDAGIGFSDPELRPGGLQTWRKAIHSVAHRRLCAHLRELRIDRGLRQSDLATLLDVPQSFVSSYENGHRRLDLTELDQICHALSTDLGAVVNVYRHRSG